MAVPLSRKIGNDILRIGWVGVRGYGRKLWDLVKDLDQLKISLCFHPNAQVAEDAAAIMKCRPCSSYDELIDSDKIDAAVLTVPNEFHFDYSQKALSKGKHVFVEKPLTNKYKEAKELKNLADEKNLVLMVGHNYRKNGYVRAIKKSIDSGKIGKVVAGEFNMGHGGGLKFGPEKWRYHIEKCPGGPLNMLGTHLIDATNFLFGEPMKVYGTVKNQFANTTTEDMSLIQLEYENGVVVNITNLYNSVSTEFINIYGTNGAIRYSKWPKETLWFQPKDIDTVCSEYEPLAFNELNPQRKIFRDFLKAILDDKIELVNTNQALKTVQIMEAALESQKKGKSIQIDNLQS